MWKSLLLFAFLSQTVNGYLLSKSDPICRDESFLFYWKSMDPEVTSGNSPLDITSNCCVSFQIWFRLILVIFFLFWIATFVPIVVNFIEGTDRRTNCCDEKKKKEKKNTGKE
ncbi:Protein CBG13229 [Caenorhabditis briggsae]|uniref:Uncharacterized protein n=2 Tax=Caenorhabditis briggsae TaxID=6238 RepID=A0AAE9EKM6_CAEBR|nr:Protein CBG13229 [Caenorhabditis briggsae]ULU00291.1 hypothetical protein L3Y34_001060 [Caenorhabditis briggsae]UMM22963.1 hypothetical protein L5515_003912 [Caenorhabditis briggsae]CAP32050.1 Protein CBG13229 [Caenorhabditis briggsae]